MRILSKAKDGGPESNVTGYFLCEIKPLFSVVLLRFEGDSRHSFHSHAFHALTWLIKGEMDEIIYGYMFPRKYEFRILPKITKRSDIHKVNSRGVSWALSIRGPWKDTWCEICPSSGDVIRLTHGRQVLGDTGNYHEQ